VLDPDLFLSFEITSHRTVIFYLGVFGTILTVARGMIPEDNRVFDPELLMTEVIMYTHYMPEEWKGELHSKKVGSLLGCRLHSAHIREFRFIKNLENYSL
jgi:autophagy-related protein 9